MGTRKGEGGRGYMVGGQNRRGGMYGYVGTLEKGMGL